MAGATEAHQPWNDKNISVISYVLSLTRDSVRVFALHGFEWRIGDHKNGMVGFRQRKALPPSAANISQSQYVTPLVAVGRCNKTRVCPWASSSNPLWTIRTQLSGIQ